MIIRLSLLRKSVLIQNTMFSCVMVYSLIPAYNACIKHDHRLPTSLSCVTTSICSRFRRVLGLCYVVVKVKLLVIVEIGVFPLICGWWLDICSLVSL